MSVASVSIGQVLDVLIDNSATHGDGMVTLRARRALGGDVLEVQDEGDGIDDDERDAIFERNHGTSAGIGLALARTITEAEGAGCKSPPRRNRGSKSYSPRRPPIPSRRTAVPEEDQ